MRSGKFFGFAILFFSFFSYSQVFIPFAFWTVADQSTTTINECPAAALGSLTISLNYGGTDATSCTYIGKSSALTGTGACSCTTGTCSVTGLTFTQAYLASMTTGVNNVLANAVNYAVARPGGTFVRSESLTITTGTWGPTCLGAPLLLWLDGTDGTTIFTDTAGLTPAANGNAVARWNDKSGHGYNATQPTSGNRPTYATASSSLAFAIANLQYMDSTLNMDTAGFSGPVGSMFAVAKQTSGNSQYMSLMGFRPAGGNFTGFSAPAGSNPVNWGFDWWTNSVYTWNPGAAGTNGAFTIVGWTNASGAQLLSVNGTTYTNTIATTSIPATPTVYLQIANDNCCGNSRYLNGNISEALVMKLNLSVSNRQQIEGYMAWKYGLSGLLPAAHPYKSAAP